MFESRSWLSFAHCNIYQNSEYQFTMMKDSLSGSFNCSSTAFHKIKHEYQLLDENLIGITLIIIINSPFRPISMTIQLVL